MKICRCLPALSCVEWLETRIAPAAAVLDLATLNGTNGFSVYGVAAGDMAGASARGIGDINGDTFPDFVIGVPYAESATTPRDSGLVAVVFGRTSGLPANLRIDQLNGTNGFLATGEFVGDAAGFSVSAGDVNGDGLGDLLIGAPYAGGTLSGVVYVVYGRETFPQTLRLSPDAPGVTRIFGEATQDFAGFSVSTAGDFNNDGKDDILIGAPSNAGQISGGAAYVVFGATGLLEVNLSTLAPSSGFKIQGEAQMDRFGSSVSSAGDFNRDGFDDVVIGASQKNASSGSAYVIFGRASSPAPVVLSALNGSNGFRIDGQAPGDQTGKSVSAAGDINNDAIDDLIVAAPGSDTNGADSGAAYVIYGRSGNFPQSVLNVSSVAGVTGFRIQGEVGQALGASAAAAGDFNRDGLKDLVIGAPGDSGSRGAAYLLLGRTTGFADVVNLADLTGTTGLKLQGAQTNDATGSAVAAAGDLNGDGFADLIIGAKLADRLDPPIASDIGRAYIAYGFGNSVPTIAIADASVTEGNSGTTVANFTVSLSAASSQTITVQYATANGTASAPSDYTSVALSTLTFAPGETAKTIPVNVLGDGTFELGETFFVNLTSPTNATVADGQGLGTILNDDAAPTLSIADASVTEGNSGTTVANFTVSLSAASSQTVTVQYATANGTASAPSDYTSVALSTLTFAPGETVKTIPVNVLGDGTFELGETFFVNLTSPTNATVADGQGLGTILNDDAAPTLSIADASVTEGNSGTTVANFTVSLSAASSQTVTVQYATANGTASAPSDYTSVALSTLTFAPGETVKTILVNVLGDGTFELGETFFVNLTSPTNATLADAQGLGTILNDDAVPTLSVGDVSVAEGNGGTTAAVFTVSLSAASSQPVTVQYATADGTAAAGTDYTALALATLTFAPGVTTQTITVNVLGDTLSEPNETFFVNLSSPSGATVADGQGLGTILNDEGVPALSIDDATVTEGNSGTVAATFTVRLSAASSQTITVQYATANGTASAPSDYTSVALSTLTFAPGETVKTIPVNVLGDGTFELGETFFVNLTSPTNATLADAQGLGTILNDDAVPTLSLSDVSVAEGNGGTTAAVFTVSLSAASSQPVTVQYATADGTAAAGTDYTALALATLTFAPGVTTQTITVNVLGDTLSEPNETFFVNLSSPSGATVADGQGLGTILNDEGVPALSIDDATVTEGNSGTVAATFTVRLSAASSQTITVQYATANGTASAPSDYTSVALSTLTFAPGETVKTIPVNVIGDGTFELGETFFVNLTSPTNATLADAQGLGTILNDDAVPTLSLSDVSVAEGNGGTTAAVFTVSLSVASSQPVTVQYVTADGTAAAGTDYTALALATLTFAPGVTTQTITVNVLGDTLSEPNETFFVNLSSPSGATVADGQGLGTILNDEGVPALSIDDATVTEGNSGTVAATFTVRLSAASSQTITVQYATANGTASAPSDYTSVALSTLTFAPGETVKTIPVNVLGDGTFELGETFFVNLTSPTNATVADAQSLGTILNDDAAPTLSIADASVTEGNSGTTVANFAVSLSAASSQTVTVQYATANGTASSPSDYTSVALSTLTFAPGETVKTIPVNVVGDGTFELGETFFVNLTSPTNATVADGQGLGTILNDDAAPTLSIADASVTEGNSGTTVANFAVSLSAASSQTVTVQYATANGTASSPDDYTPLGLGVLTFAPGETIKTVAVDVLGDTTVEPDESIFISLSNPTSATLSDAQGLGTILNDDPVPTISVGVASVDEGNSSTTVANVVVSLSGASSQTITVQYSTADGTANSPGDYTLLPLSTLTFAPGETEKVVLVSIIGEVDVEQDEVFSVNLSNAGNATLGGSEGLITILNDDQEVVIRKGDATFKDADGDTVLVQSSRGTLKPENFVFSSDGTLAMIDLTTGAPGEFDNANISIGVTDANGANGAKGGNGAVKVGFLNAAGVNLKAVKIQGDLGQIMAGDGSGKTAVKSLAIAGNLGGFAGSPRLSQLLGNMAKLKVGGSVQKDSVQIDGKVNIVLIKGDLTGLGNLGVETLAGIADVGLAEFSSRGGAIPAGVFSAEGIGLIKVLGGIKGGAITTNKDLGFASILGDLSGGIMAGGSVNKIKVAGSMRADATEPPVTITARNKIDSLVVDGDVENARILVGYDRDEMPVNADARLGKIVVNGDWEASSLGVGIVDSTGDGFGRNDEVIGGATSAISRIASITIKGTAIGSVAAGDHFGITAGQIGKVRIGVTRAPLSNAVDDIEIDATNHDFRVVEIG